MPIISATQEAEIRRMMVPSQPGANSSQNYILKNPSQKRLVEWLKVQALSSRPVLKKKIQGSQKT
jgi:hypothetical protein